MTLEELKNMNLHDIAPSERGSLALGVQRVPNGWNYIYLSGPVFVPETLVIQQHIEPRK